MASDTYAHHFTDRNIPFGVASSKTHPSAQCATRLENRVIFLQDWSSLGIFNEVEGLPKDVFSNDTLNEFAALPKSVQQAVRRKIQETCRNGTLESSAELRESFEDIKDVTVHMPVRVGDFTDFSCSLEHVKNAGRIIVNDERPPPAFFNLPVGYQGRASSIVVSGTDIERPIGQFRDRSSSVPHGDAPSIACGPSQMLDYELEFAAIIGKPLPMGRRLNAIDADDHIFGFVILNDWSARDIQGFEMVPLGPLNGKNFGTSISPWIVTLDALDPFRVKGVEHTAQIPRYLQDPEAVTHSVRMQVELLTESTGKSTVLGVSDIQELYWSIRQMIAHLVSAGSSLRTGDVLATGTVTGRGKDSMGSLLEVTSGGAQPIKLQDGDERKFLLDGDVVRMTAVAGGDDSGVGFGECVGKVLPSRPID